MSLQNMMSSHFLFIQAPYSTINCPWVFAKYFYKLANIGFYITKYSTTQKTNLRKHNLFKIESK